jgi:malonyl-CoA decarboxylase
MARRTVASAASPGQAINAIGGLLATLSRYGRDILRGGNRGAGEGQAVAPADQTFADLARALVSSRGEASGVAIANDLVALYSALDDSDKVAVFARLAEDFGSDEAALERAWQLYREGGDANLPALARAVEAPRQELFRRLNLAEGGTFALVRMRADLLSMTTGRTRELVDADLSHVLQSWFNRGFLSMRPLNWSSPARLLENLIRFEAVHHIRDWDDLRNRLAPPDRRCFAFFHPLMPEEPLIFVEVALTRGMADNVQDILTVEREPITAEAADTANFYSISNCQSGLRGISFGHFLIKDVAVHLRRELPRLRTFCTLSPIPGLMNWLREQGEELAERAADRSWPAEDPEGSSAQILQKGADYLLNARNANGLPLDPVARFHLSNGARLERINWAADTSKKGRVESAGLMVNYLYDMDAVEANHEAFVHERLIAAAPAVQRLAAGPRVSVAA